VRGRGRERERARGREKEEGEEKCKREASIRKQARPNRQERQKQGRKQPPRRGPPVGSHGGGSPPRQRISQHNTTTTTTTTTTYPHEQAGTGPNLPWPWIRTGSRCRSASHPHLHPHPQLARLIRLPACLSAGPPASPRLASRRGKGPAASRLGPGLPSSHQVPDARAVVPRCRICIGCGRSPCRRRRIGSDSASPLQRSRGSCKNDGSTPSPASAPSLSPLSASS
jgi:hypothetical protein